MFSVTILSRSVGGCELVINSMYVTVIFHRFGNELTIVGS